MTSIKEAAAEFLAPEHRIVVTGVSRRTPGQPANAIYKRLRERGYLVEAVNPRADEVEGDPCWPDLASIPGVIDGVVIAAPADTAEETLRQCAELHIPRVWMHRSVGHGSVCHEATVYGRRHGITVLEGGCPLMFGPTADPFHKVMRLVCTATGKVPRQV